MPRSSATLITGAMNSLKSNLRSWSWVCIPVHISTSSSSPSMRLNTIRLKKPQCAPQLSALLLLSRAVIQSGIKPIFLSYFLSRSAGVCFNNVSFLRSNWFCYWNFFFFLKNLLGSDSASWKVSVLLLLQFMSQFLLAFSFSLSRGAFAFLIWILWLYLPPQVCVSTALGTCLSISGICSYAGASHGDNFFAVPGWWAFDLEAWWRWQEDFLCWSCFLAGLVQPLLSNDPDVDLALPPVTIMILFWKWIQAEHIFHYLLLSVFCWWGKSSLVYENLSVLQSVASRTQFASLPS